MDLELLLHLMEHKNLGLGKMERYRINVKGKLFK
tara:strand:+ start:66 stop:167 length:102 start_codon:yes stop_codon:yes gene_type:complete